MNDTFLNLVRPSRGVPGKAVPHSERAHSKFAASAAERWFECPGSVELSEGMPDKSSPWAEEGTFGHEVLEWYMKERLAGNVAPDFADFTRAHLIENGIASYNRGIVPEEMRRHTLHAASFILARHAREPYSEILLETRTYLDFIHAEMFGTFDAAVIDHFESLDVFDYKYGAGHFVSPTENLQMIFYGLGLAAKLKWNFKRVRLWIVQPRVKGYDGPLFWELSMRELHRWADKFRVAVTRVLARPDEFKEGSWCHWCKAKSVCPLKTEAKMEKARSLFSMAPVG